MWFMVVGWWFMVVGWWFMVVGWWFMVVGWQVLQLLDYNVRANSEGLSGSARVMAWDWNKPLDLPRNTT